MTFEPMPLLRDFCLEDIDYLMRINPYLRGYLHGYLAELVLMRQIAKIPGVDSVVKIPDLDDRRGDLEVLFLGVSITIECKSINSDSVRMDEVHDTWTGTVKVKTSDRRGIVIDGEMRYLTNVSKGHFDILAVNCFAVDEKWDFVFIENKLLLEKADTPGFIASSLHINPTSTPGLFSDLPRLLYKTFLQKVQSLG